MYADMSLRSKSNISLSLAPSHIHLSTIGIDMNKKQQSTSGSPFEKEIGFSRATRVGNTIAVSGTAPLDEEGNTVHVDDLYEQTKHCLSIIKKAIEDVDGKLDDIVRTRIFLKEIENWKESARAHGEIFADIRPACTFVEVSRFIREDWLVEIEADCHVDA